MCFSSVSGFLQERNPATNPKGGDRGKPQIHRTCQRFRITKHERLGFSETKTARMNWPTVNTPFIDTHLNHGFTINNLRGCWLYLKIAVFPKKPLSTCKFLWFIILISITLNDKLPILLRRFLIRGQVKNVSSHKLIWFCWTVTLAGLQVLKSFLIVVKFCCLSYSSLF